MNQLNLHDTGGGILNVYKGTGIYKEGMGYEAILADLCGSKTIGHEALKIKNQYSR